MEIERGYCFFVKITYQGVGLAEQYYWLKDCPKTSFQDVHLRFGCPLFNCDGECTSLLIRHPSSRRVPFHIPPSYRCTLGFQIKLIFCWHRG